MNAQRTTDILSALVVADTPAEALADLQRRWPDITAEEIEAVRLLAVADSREQRTSGT